MKNFKVLTIQISNFINSTIKSTEIIFSQIEHYICSNLDTDLVILPELVFSSYILNNKKSFLKKYNLKNLEKIKKIAKKYQKMILYPDITIEDKKIFNSSYLIDDNGNVLGVSNKIHIPDNEKGIFSAGNDYSIIDTPFARFGILICYDAHFPESFRILKKLGVEIVLLPINSCVHYHEIDIDIENWRSICKYNALVNSMYVVMCNKTERIGVLDHYHTGHSITVDPFGTIISELGMRENYSVVELKKDIYEKYQNTYKKHLRNDLYYKYDIYKKQKR